MADFLLVDTDILIDAGREIDQAINFLLDNEEKYQLAISAVTQMELMIGCRNKTELRALEQFLNRFEIIPLDDLTARTAIELIRTYHLSHGLLIADALIAATAITLQAPLATKNYRDYRFVESLKLKKYP